jgi:hypothetical protein
MKDVSKERLWIELRSIVKLRFIRVILGHISLDSDEELVG